MIEQKRKIFEETLTSKFDSNQYVLFLRELLHDVQLIAPGVKKNPYNTFSAAIDHYCHIGQYTGRDGNRVALFSVCLKKEENIQNARSMQRNFVKTLLGNCAGALVAFYTENEPEKWRLSLVRMDYEFSKGKISEKLTPAKRYSYLVGQGEPCHTAMDRLYPIFMDDELRPTLDELEEAFSVEAVTKEFFDRYREKYLDIKLYLDDNPDFVRESTSRGFTSEQFAKKLLGQIVFLYFIQKKGWLGVKAIPQKLKESEFKAAFYHPGWRHKEIMQKVFKQSADGTYVRDTEAFLSLSEDDETELAKHFPGDPWGTGPKDFMRQIFKECEKARKNYFDDYLEPFFYTGLNCNRGENAYFPPLHRRIPFLSGGLFEEMQGYDWRHNEFSIPNEMFSNVDEKGRDADGILDVFDRFNFTMAEDEPMEREVAIDPEMLGKVFENLLDVKDRKSKGAFYTPREIVHYMCQESLINYLAGKMGIADEDIRKFILYGEYFRDTDTQKTLRVQDEKTGKVHYEFDRNKEMEIPESILSYKDNVNRLQEMDMLLENVKIADPAVGSGAFPLGMLNEIVKARQTITAYMQLDMDPFRRRIFRSDRSPYWLKRAAIKNSIFACDIEPSAVDITRLRLWLSLVIDNQIGKQDDEEMGYSTKPIPLPNLDSNIICGNSLMDEFEGVKLLTENAVLGNQSDKSQYTLYDQTLGYMINDLIDLQSKLYDEKDNNEKESLKQQIQAIYDQIILEQLKVNPELIDKYYQVIQQPTKPFILWQLYFPKVFRDNNGFDIVIGNPPYVDSEEMTRSMANEREVYSHKYKSAKGNWDLFVLFIEKGMLLLNSNGVITFIVPNKLVSAPYTTSIRKIISENQVIELRDYSDVNVFKSASVYPVVFRIRISNEKRPVIMDVMDGIEHVSKHNVIDIDNFYADIDWDKFFKSSPIDLQIVDKMKQYEKLGNLCKVNGGATVSEAYLVKEFIYDSFDNESEALKFINTGGIDPYISFHGKAPMRYLKESYNNPYVGVENIKKMSLKRYEESLSEKIIIGGMTKRLEAFYDSGNYYAAKSTTIVYANNNLKYITAVINSKLMSFFYRVFYNSMSLAGGFFRIGAPQIKELPIAWPKQRETLDRIESIVDEIQQLLSEGNNNDISSLITEIDNYIFEIYGLSQEEITHLNNI